MAQPDYPTLSTAHRAGGPSAGYLSGINSRRVRGALAPLLRGTSLSKDAVSRLVGRLRDEFNAWSARDLTAEQVCYLFLDGWYPRVRIGKKRARVPVLVTLGVCADGRRVVLDMRIAGKESEPAWRELFESLVARHLGTPLLAVVDGNPGLQAALRAQWPEICDPAPARSYCAASMADMTCRSQTLTREQRKKQLRD
jgi:transposase-like protein